MTTDYFSEKGEYTHMDQTSTFGPYFFLESSSGAA